MEEHHVTGTKFHGMDGVSFARPFDDKAICCPTDCRHTSSRMAELRKCQNANASKLRSKFLPAKLPDLPRPVGIVTLKDRMISPVAQLFIDCAREAAKAL